MQPIADRAAVERARQLIVAHGAAVDLYTQWFHETTGDLLTWPAANAYRAAILDPSQFEPGWRVLASAPGAAGACVAMRGGRERIVAPPEMVPEHTAALSPSRGAMLRVHPLTSGEVNGFWHVWSAGWQAGAPAHMERCYFRVHATRAIEFAALVAGVARPRSVWAMKILCGTHDAGRRDVALVYRPADAPVEAWVERLCAAAEPLCDGELPPCVSPVRRSIGRAPDPGDGRSFGQAVAEAVKSAAPLAADAEAFAAAACAAIAAIPGMANASRDPVTA